MPSWHVRYNEERGQEGDFWYHLFFCDRNKAAVSQLEKYTVIIVYYKNCIMPTQVIFFPRKEKKSVFPMTSSPPPTQKWPHHTSTCSQDASDAVCHAQVSRVSRTGEPCVTHRWAVRRSPAGQRESRPLTVPAGPVPHSSSLRPLRLCSLARSSSPGASHVK